MEFLKPTQSNKNKVKKEFEKNTETFWDPTGKINLKEIKKNSLEILSKYEKLKHKPNIAYKQERNGIIFVIFGSALGLYLLLNIEDISMFMLVISILCISLPWIYSFLLVSYYRNLTIDLIKSQMAKKNGWLYDPKQNRNKSKKLAKQFPEIFQNGDVSQCVEDQFWGSFKNEHNNKVEFNSGKFNFIRVHINKTEVINRYYFIFKISKQIKSRFFLYPISNSNREYSVILAKNIKLESIKFNNKFNYSYFGDNQENVLEIVKTLSPAIQEKINKLEKTENETNILFCNNTIVFCFNGVMLKEPTTDFTENIEINSKDIKTIEKQIKLLIEISTEISEYLD